MKHESQQQLKWHDDPETTADYLHIMEITNSSKTGLKAFSTKGKTFLLLKRNLENQAFSLIHKLKLLIIICFTLLEDLNYNKVSSSTCEKTDI